MNLSLDRFELPVRLRSERQMSDSDLLHFCESNESLKIEREPDGDLLIMTPSGFRTSHANIRIARLLDEWSEVDNRGISTGPDGGYILPDNSMRSPDAAWVLVEKVSHLTDKQQDEFAPVCPDFVIELRSPSDRPSVLKKKMEQWIANGAAVAWLIDPKKRTVTIYRSGEAPEELIDPSSVQGTGPVRGFELVMARVWG